MTTAGIVLVAAILILPDLLAADTEFRPYSPGSNRYVAAHPNPNQAWNPSNRQANLRFNKPPPIVRSGYRSGGQPPPPGDKLTGDRVHHSQDQFRSGAHPRHPVGTLTRTPLRPPPIVRSRGPGGNIRQPPMRHPGPPRQPWGNPGVPHNRNYG